MERIRTLGFICLALVLMTGCVRRRLTVRSNPPGAQVFIDKQFVGVTPVSTKFTYYGTREIQLIRDGYQTTTVQQPIPAKWYEIPPLDFFSETVWPFEIRDERTVEVNMLPQPQVPTQEIVQRAEQMRQNTAQGVATPLPPRY